MDREQRYGDYSDPTTSHHHHHHHHRNSHSATSSWSSEDPPPPPPYPHRNFDTPHSVGFSGDGHYDHRPHYNHHRYNNRYHQNFNSGQNDSDIGHTSSLSGFKRHYSHSSYGPYPDYIDGGNCVKLYVGGIPRTSTEEEIHSLFEQHGTIVEVILIKDKTTGQQQEYCFVKYEMLEEANRAIRALNNQYTFPGMVPIKVRYAAKERERLWGFGEHEHKLYVGCLNKQASIREIEEEIEEIFSAYGFVKDVFIVRDEFDQSRGFGFITFYQREMAVAAIKALSGTYFMRGCDQPLIVRFAEPKKPRMGESRPAPYLNDPMAGQMLPNASLSPSPKSMASYSQSPGTDGKQQTVSSTITLSELVLPSSTSSASAMLVSTQTAESLDCDWSEHTCPDGYKYYYNCITCESKWEKPEEYSFYEQQLQKLQQRLSSCQQVFSSQEVSQMQQVQLQTQLSIPKPEQPSLSASEPDIVQVQAVTSNMTPIVAPTCV